VERADVIARCLVDDVGRRLLDSAMSQGYFNDNHVHILEAYADGSADGKEVLARLDEYHGKERRKNRRRLFETLKDCVLLLLVVVLYSLGVLEFEWTVILLLVCIGAEVLHWSRLLFLQIEEGKRRQGGTF
jgi:hypothetical protein